MEIKVARAGARRRNSRWHVVALKPGGRWVEAMDEDSVCAKVRDIDPTGPIEMNAVRMWALLTALIGTGALVADDGDGWAE
jgi:hypothetical protein